MCVSRNWLKDDIIQSAMAAVLTCDTYFTYYLYLIYDKAVKNAEGIAV